MIMKKTEEVFKALSDITRQRLLSVLMQGQFNVAELSEILSLKQSRTSRHLNIMLRAHLIKVTREGSWKYYSVANFTETTDNFNKFTNEILNSVQQYFSKIEVNNDDLKNIQEIYKKRRSYTQNYFNNINDWNTERKAAAGDISLYHDIIKKESGSIAVDLGTGNGYIVSVLSENFNKVIGIDNSHRMLGMANIFLSERGIKNSALLLAELEEIPLDDDYADLVTLIMTIHHIPKPEKAISEIMRIKKPSGKFIIIDFKKHSDETMRERYADIWLGFDTEQIKKYLTLCGAKEIEFKFIKNNDKEIFLCTGK